MATSPEGITYYYLSQLLGARVQFEGDGAASGRLHDIGVRKAAQYPQASCLEVRSRKLGTVVLPWSAVVELSPRTILVRKANGAAPPMDFWLRRDVLDDQVVDISGAKVWRVNDLHLLYAEAQLIVAHVEVGVLGILRRLGIERPVCALLRWLFDYTVKDSFVSWRKVELTGLGGSPAEVRVSAAASPLSEIHPAELADIMEQLGVTERHRLFERLDVETAAETLEEVAPDVQRVLMSQEEPGKAADILEEMEAKDAADVLRELPDPDAQKIISRMESEAAEDVRELLAHEEETAGGVMHTACIEARPDEMAEAVLKHIRSGAEEVAVLNVIYVLDEKRRLLGVISLRELFLAKPDARLDSIMVTHVIKVWPRTSVRDVGRLFVKYGLRAVPVVDEHDVFLGAVRVRDVLGELAPLVRE